MRKTVVATIILGLGSLVFAEPVIPIDKEAMKAKVAKIAGETSPFNKNENFPKEYFQFQRTCHLHLD